METLPAWEDHDRRVRPYVFRHRLLAVGQKAAGAAFVLAVVFFRLLDGAGTGFPSWLVAFGLLALGWRTVSFPFSVAAWRVERAFGLSRQTFGAWLKDQGKGLLVGAVLGAAALGAFYLSIRLFPAAWWAAAATLVIVFSILLAQLAPVVLVPLFFKLRPLEPGPLKDRLLKLSGDFGVAVRDVYHIGLGEKTEKGNAAFLGIGRTKRIVIGDTLYQKFPPEEVEAVFAHELGHQVHHDLWRGILFSALWTYATFLLAHALARAHLLPPFGASFGHPFGFFLFLIVLGVVAVPVGVIETAYSRGRERKADLFAAGRLGEGAKLADALERLTFQNWGLFRPHPLLEFLAYSHPAPGRRIRALRAGTSRP